jgi:hypothetical protein
LLVVLFPCPNTVRAQEHPVAADEREMAPPLTAAVAKPSRWYGWQILAVDVASIGVTALGVEIVSFGAGHHSGWGIAGVGLAGYLLTSPLLHLSHDNGWALGSVLLRAAAIGLTIVGTAQFGICVSDSSTGCWGAAGPLMLVGGLVLAAGTTLADSILAVERPRPRKLQVMLTPWLSPRAEAAGLTLLGRW